MATELLLITCRLKQGETRVYSGPMCYLLADDPTTRPKAPIAYPAEVGSRTTRSTEETPLRFLASGSDGGLMTVVRLILDNMSGPRIDWLK